MQSISFPGMASLSGYSWLQMLLTLPDFPFISPLARTLPEIYANPAPLEWIQAFLAGSLPSSHLQACSKVRKYWGIKLKESCHYTSKYHVYHFRCFTSYFNWAFYNLYSSKSILTSVSTATGLEVTKLLDYKHKEVLITAIRHPIWPVHVIKCTSDSSPSSESLHLEICLLVVNQSRSTQRGRHPNWNKQYLQSRSISWFWAQSQRINFDYRRE